MSKSKAISIITEEGRIIFETIKSPSTEYAGSAKVNDQGQRVQDQAVTLAFPKRGAWQDTEWGKAIMEAVNLNCPHHAAIEGFKYGVLDGDKPRINKTTGELMQPQEYQKNCWLLLASSAQQLAGDRGIDVVAAATATPIPATAWKCGDYGHLDIGILVRKDLKGTRIFLNGLAVSREGEAIEGSRPSSASRFKAAGLGGGAPVQAVAQAPVQAPMAQSSLIMTDKAQGRSAEDFRAIGINDDAMVAAGLAIRI